MEIVVAEHTGFCSGVLRAVQDAQEVLKKDGRLYCLGDIIHNRSVVNRLKRRGMVVVEDIESIPEGSSFVLRSHGLPVENIEQARQKRLKIYDMTCPRVKNIHHLVKKQTEENCFIIGNPKHPEVRAIVSLTRGNAYVVEKPDDLAGFDSLKHAFVVVQTTFNPSLFLEITQRIIFFSKETVVYNTLCEGLIKRQKEAVRIADGVDLVIVVGGKNSSNTKTLYNIARQRKRAVHVESSDEINREMLKDVQKVGIVSGASTPAEEVNRVVDTLKRLSGEQHNLNQPI